MNLEFLKKYSLYQFSSEMELIKSIELISQNFTKNRSKIEDYVKDPKMVSAYSLFYLSTNFSKFEAVISKLGKEIVSDQIVEIGCGPGTFVWAAKQRYPDKEILGIEKSPLMREQANKYLQNFYSSTENFVFDIHHNLPSSQSRCLIFGHSANEIPLQSIEDYIKAYNPDEILFIEPGTKEYFSKSLMIRDWLISKQYNIQYPCPSNGHCPAQKIEGEWCHQYLKIKHDPDVERLCQLVRKDRRMLPQTIHYYNRLKSDFRDSVVQRFRSKQKFGITLDICEECTKDTNSIKCLEILNRKMNKKSIKRLESILAGDRISYKLEKNIDSNKVRGSLVGFFE